jgi:endonuclease YncB( thermonuclease family)
MIRIVSLALWMTWSSMAVPGPAPVGELLELRVVRGDLLVGRLGGEPVGLRLAGVWVPAPPAPGQEHHYRGAAARRFVEQTLLSQPVAIVPLAEPELQREVPVRVWVGGRGGRELAVLLAEAGLALLDRSSAVDDAQAQAVRAAERRARRAQVGMHDGGYQEFARTQAKHKDLGLLVWYGRRGGEEDEATPEGDEGAEVPRVGWWVQPRSAEHRTPIEAIRDHGAGLGLPPDGSRSGH